MDNIKNEIHSHMIEHPSSDFSLYFTDESSGTYNKIVGPFEVGSPFIKLKDKFDLENRTEIINLNHVVRIVLNN